MGRARLIVGEEGLPDHEFRPGLVIGIFRYDRLTSLDKAMSFGEVVHDGIRYALLETSGAGVEDSLAATAKAAAEDIMKGYRGSGLPDALTFAMPVRQG